MTDATINPRAQAWLTRLDGWKQRGPARSILIKAGVTVVGPFVILTGVAMTVLPGPGLVVVALGLAVLALEYRWARHTLGLMGRTVTRARDAAVPRGRSRGRQALGVMTAGAFLVGTTALTAGVTALLGTLTIL